MRTSKKTLSSLIAAVFVSGSLVGSANALDFGSIFGDASGDEAVSVQTQKIQNERALRSARNVLILPAQGSFNGEERLTADQQRVSNVRISDASNRKPLPILQFQGDWNGTAKKGFPHQ